MTAQGKRGVQSAVCFPRIRAFNMKLKKEICAANINLAAVVQVAELLLFSFISLLSKMLFSRRIN